MAHNRSGRQVRIGQVCFKVGLDLGLSYDLSDQHYAANHDGRREVVKEQHPFQKDVPQHSGWKTWFCNPDSIVC